MCVHVCLHVLRNYKDKLPTQYKSRAFWKDVPHSENGKKEEKKKKKEKEERSEPPQIPFLALLCETK